MASPAGCLQAVQWVCEVMRGKEAYLAVFVFFGVLGQSAPRP
jgi:hypothetical protein